MKSIALVALALVAVAAALPVEQQNTPVIVNQFLEQKPDGSYQSSFETSDGTKKTEEGTLKTVQNEENKPQNVIVVRGEFTYKNIDGSLETIRYYADENGYRAEGDSIPKQ